MDYKSTKTLPKEPHGYASITYRLQKNVNVMLMSCYLHFCQKNVTYDVVHTRFYYIKFIL